jgi:hypothetical protein
VTATQTEVPVRLRRPHPKQAAFIDCTAPRTIIRAGRRSGKTTGAATKAVKRFLAGRRILYGVPTQEQVDRFWFEIKRALAEPLDRGLFYKNETLHLIEVPGTENRIRAKTAWDADTLRGDYADLLILDEYQLMGEDAWGRVGVPMLLDNKGDAVFIYTPPSLHSRSRTKARDPQHAAKLFKKAEADKTGRWAAVHFTSHDNPRINTEALAEITQDMTALAYEQEIMAEDKDEAPGALWTRDLLERTRVATAPDLARIVVGIDPPGGATECGIIVSGIGINGEYYVSADCSLQASPSVWASAVVTAYQTYEADRALGEKNYGGDMVRNTLENVEGGMDIAYEDVTATRGKAVRAEPIAALFEQGRAHLVGSWPALEDELTMWVPGQSGYSPNRLDAMVWGLTYLKTSGLGFSIV